MTGRTGGSGGRWVELEKPKPRPVADRYAYWGGPPLERSEACAYWLRQIEAGWRPNRRWSCESYDTSAGLYGVYIWEFLHVLQPALQAARQAQPAPLTF